MEFRGGWLTVFAATVLCAADESGYSLFQKGLAKERADADLRGAMKIYEQVIKQNGKDHKLAAQALFRIAECQQALGDKAARQVYERLLREYPDQREIVAQTQSRLAAMGGTRDSGIPAKRRVCPDCGDTVADISPDGRWMAAPEWEISGGDLAVRDLASGQVKRLMVKATNDSKAYSDDPVFSPDLRQLVFNWEDDAGHCQLRIMPNEAGGKWRVVADVPEYSYYSPAAWHADGKSVLATLFKRDQSSHLAWVSLADGAIKVIKPLGWRSRAGSYSRPRLSPDGRYIAYGALVTNPSSANEAGGSTDQRIYLLAADGSGETELVKTAGINNGPVWTSDGKHILFLSDRSGTLGLWSVPVENGKAAGVASQVIPRIGDVRALGMTRSGTYFYTQREMGSEQVVVAGLGPDPARAQSRDQRAADSFVGIRPTWSPDGKLLAFSRHRPPMGGDSFDLVVQSVETGEETVYPFPGTRPGPMRWYRDGSALLVMVDPPGKKRSLYRLELKTKEFKLVMEADTKTWAPAISELSRDDKTLYLAARNPEKNRNVDRIVAIDLDSGNQRPVLNIPTTGGTPLSFRLSPDGKTLAIRRQDPQDRKIHFGRVSVDGSGYRELHTVGAGGGFDVLAWTADGRGILFEERKDTDWRILRMPAEGGTPEFTGVSGSGILQSMDVSRDGARLAYSTTRNLDELWALDNVLPALK